MASPQVEATISVKYDTQVRRVIRVKVIKPLATTNKLVIRILIINIFNILCLLAEDFNSSTHFKI